MEAHPLFVEVSEVCNKYPEQAGPIWQAYLDLKLSQRWDELEIIDLEDAHCCILSGRNPKQADGCKHIIYPMNLAGSTSMEALQIPFKHLKPAPDSVLLAITSEDSSIVYYKISAGIVAPKEVKD